MIAHMRETRGRIPISSVALIITGNVASPAAASADETGGEHESSTAPVVNATSTVPEGCILNVVSTAFDDGKTGDQNSLLAGEYMNFKGFCLIGNDPNGSCRGASSSGAQCILGTAGGAGTGALGGAALGPGGAAEGAVSAGVLAANRACFKLAAV